ncbi:hypothetical protein QQS21_005857 [Conoideocrella luteorostrata]|uniref:Uncharacterized protein n=1 Tax=Conoideocrella luteorostrata TaxID=1105319 RepID=A0AAJ0CSY6_9HYPO|nr:hypothetical protein QQS21_005857 [Conoideocrella luteorostrata]
MSVSIVGNDGSWTVNTDKEIHYDFSADDGQLKLNVVGKEDGKVDGVVTLGPVDIGTKDNHISIGGGSQEVKYDGSLKYGKTTVNLLGGSFDLGEGRTDDFQFSFTMEQTALGPQWTGIATNNFVETKSFEIQDADVKFKSKEAETPIFNKKDALFDVAGVIIPGCRFTEWAKHVDFKISMDIAVDGKKVTVTVTRALTFEIRPVFKPNPENKWPERPPPPGFLDMRKKAVQEITQKLLERRVLFQFVEDSLHEVQMWQTVESAIQKVGIATAAVSAATAVAIAAAAVAAAFLEMNPVADAAEVGAAATLAAEMAELAAAKAGVTAAKSLLTWGVEQVTFAVIATRATATLAVLAAAVVVGTTLSADAIDYGATKHFKYLAEKHGLESAGSDLGRLANSLTEIKSELSSDIASLTEELRQAMEALQQASELAHKLLEYQTLLESWTADPQHVPFLTWPDTNLRITDSSEDAEVVELGDISTPQKFAAEAAKQEAYASAKGYTGFVIIPYEKKAYFRRRDVVDLLATIDKQDYSKNWTSYIKAQRLPMDVLVSRWAVIDGAKQA